MTAALTFDIGLAVAVLTIAGWIVAARDAFAAVVGFVVYGLLLALVWVRLSAVDVAMTEVAVGSGVTGVLLLRAVARTRADGVQAERPSAALRAVAAALCTMVAAALAVVVFLAAEPAPSLAPLAAEHLTASGLGNPVTAVLMTYRAFDTFLEKVVLLLALIGVWSLASDYSWGGAPTLWRPGHRDGALIFLAQVLIPVGVVIGIFIFWIGAIRPGGAFQGGAILAAMWMLAMMAGLARAPPVGQIRLRLALVAGAAAFLVVGLAGFAIAEAFFAYPAAHAKTLIIVIEVVMVISIGATLTLLVAGPSERRGEQ